MTETKFSARITVPMPVELEQKLRIAAAYRSTSRAGLIRDAVEFYLKYLQDHDNLELERLMDFR